MQKFVERSLKKSIIILAAGDGSRLKSSTPKVFHKIGGLSMLDHVINASTKISANEIAVVLKPEYANYTSQIPCDFQKAFQPKAKGTADTVKYGLECLTKSDEGWIYILYADIPLISPTSLNEMLKIAEANSNTAVVVLAFDSRGTKDLGKLAKAGKPGTISRIIEAKDITPADQTIPLCNAGMLVRRDVLNDLLYKIEPSPKTGEIYITEIVRLAYENGYDCRYYEASKDELSGANTRSELAALEKTFQEKMRKQCLDNGVTLISPETVFFSYDTKIEQDVVVHPYVVFGAGVEIKSGAEIGPFCVVEGATIGDAKIGPFSRLRPGSEISDDVRIGNFVEVKNSYIGCGAKVNHLTYIGDSSIGDKTNIGAGTITCNYDGFKKYKTIIGKNVFIGSNSALVAPVKIEDGALIAAGSTITKNVSEDSLGIARGKQVNVEGWAKSFKKSKEK